MTAQDTHSCIAQAWQEYIAEVTADLLIEARTLHKRGRLHAEALMALTASVGCVREALRDPTLRNVGASIRVTIGNKEVHNA